MLFSRKTLHRRWLAALVLAVYGSVGVLGYGLHMLTGCDYCHVAAGHHHAQHSDHCCATHHIPGPGERVLASAETCAICSLLAQAQSEHAGELPVLCTAISHADPIASEMAALPLVVRLHLARGPPLA